MIADMCAHVAEVPSGGSSVRRPGSEDPHTQVHQKYPLYVDGRGDNVYGYRQRQGAHRCELISLDYS